MGCIIKAQKEKEKKGDGNGGLSRTRQASKPDAIEADE